MEPAESWKMDKEEAALQRPEGPILCANNCGFFGSATTMNLCSQCYRGAGTAQANTAEAAAAMAATMSAEPQQNVGIELESGAAAAASSAIVSAQKTADPLAPQPNRCFTCKKRVGLTGFKCKCGNQFCSLHRYHDKHDCAYDYRAAARDAIARANPVVKADKLDKI